MPGTLILNEDWSDYDKKKSREAGDKSKFSSEEKWEVEYLVRKIVKRYHFILEGKIRKAIEACSREIPAPHPREEFVHCVMRKLLG